MLHCLKCSPVQTRSDLNQADAQAISSRELNAGHFIKELNSLPKSTLVTNHPQGGEAEEHF